MLYDGWVSEIAARFQRRFEEIKATYNFDLGDEFEIAVADLLKQMLPERYGVCRGFVVEQSGAVAGDDIIIYDRARFPTLRFLGDDLARKDHVPAEAVLAYIEAKHRLQLQGEGGQSLRKACAQVAAVRALKRKPVPMNMVTPHLELMCDVRVPTSGWPSIRNPLYCAVFARHVEPSTGAREALYEGIRQLCDAGTKVPDVVAAGGVMSVPALLKRPPPGGGGKVSVAIRPFLDVPGNQPIFCNPEAVFGIALVHLLSSIEIVSLGNLPWMKMINESVSTGGDSFTAWIE
jgi:hypothetical protein